MSDSLFPILTFQISQTQQWPPPLSSLTKVSLPSLVSAAHISDFVTALASCLFVRYAARDLILVTVSTD